MPFLSQAIFWFAFYEVDKIEWILQTDLINMQIRALTQSLQVNSKKSLNLGLNIKTGSSVNSVKPGLIISNVIIWGLHEEKTEFESYRKENSPHVI